MNPSRRRVLRTLAALPALAFAQDPRNLPIVPGLRIIRSSVNTAIFERNNKTLLIDSGEIDKIPAEWALYTHHHPDQASGAARLAAATKIAVPAAERHFFEDAHAVWDTADTRLDRYEIRAVTSGTEALGEVTVQLDAGGRKVLGRGVSTDVIEASAKAYIDGLNKLSCTTGHRC